MTRAPPNGPSAVQAALDHLPDVVLLDIGLPGLTGHEVARQLRLHPELRGVILVALTSNGCDQDRQTSLEAGFDHHLVKPVQLDQLEQLLKRVAGSLSPLRTVIDTAT